MQRQMQMTSHSTSEGVGWAERTDFEERSMGPVDLIRHLQTQCSQPAICFTCTTGAQHRRLEERPILSGYRWQF